VLRVNPKASDIFAEPFRRYMQAAGWVEGRNVRYDFVWADMRLEQIPALASELVTRNVDLNEGLFRRKAHLDLAL
jgi:putative tryptophan/tyrosine transport system substrate-binding protein